MATVQTAPNCVDIIRPFAVALEADLELPDVQMMGGIGSAALKHSGTVILPDEKRIVTSDAFSYDNPDLSQYRPNGTLRDLDMLVLTDDEGQMQAVEALARQTVGSDLVISAFRLLQGEHLEAQKGHRLV